MVLNLRGIVVLSFSSTPWPRQRVTSGPQLGRKSVALLSALHLNYYRTHSRRLAAERIIRWFTGKTEQLATRLANTWLSASAVSRRTALSADWRDRQVATLMSCFWCFRLFRHQAPGYFSVSVFTPVSPHPASLYIWRLHNKDVLSPACYTYLLGNLVLWYITGWR
jgi:hypothetical protein